MGPATARWHLGRLVRLVRRFGDPFSDEHQSKSTGIARDMEPSFWSLTHSISTEEARRDLKRSNIIGSLSKINASGWRPSLLGWRPSLLGWRPLLLNAFDFI